MRTVTSKALLPLAGTSALCIQLQLAELSLKERIYCLPCWQDCVEIVKVLRFIDTLPQRDRKVFSYEAQMTRLEEEIQRNRHRQRTERRRSAHQLKKSAERHLLPGYFRENPERPADQVAERGLCGSLPHLWLQAEVNGSASFLLDAGEELLDVLEDPIRAQVCLRNIFEMTFDGMERATQQERLEKLCQVYSSWETVNGGAKRRSFYR